METSWHPKGDLCECTDEGKNEDDWQYSYVILS